MIRYVFGSATWLNTDDGNWPTVLPLWGEPAVHGSLTFIFLLPVNSLRKFGNSSCHRRDDRPLRDCTSLDGAKCAGADTSI